MKRRGLAGVASLALLLTLLSLPSAASTSQSVAIQRLQQALAVDPGNLPLRYYLGVNLLLDGDDQGAIEQFRAAYPAFADSVEMNYNFALAQTRLGDIDSALLYLERAQELGGSDVQQLYPLASVYYNLALLRLGEDQTGPAIDLLQKSLQLNPDNDDIQRLLGDIFNRRNQPEQALQHWQLYLNRYPGDEQVREQIFTLYYNDGLKALESGDLAAASQAFDNGLELMPDSPLARYYLGYLAYQSGQHQQAISELGKVQSEIPPELQESTLAMIYNSASELLAAGQPEAALPAAELLTRGAPDDYRSRYLAGRIHLTLKQFLPARDDFLEVLKLQPAHSGATLNLITAEQGAAEQAFEEGRQLYRQGAFRQSIDRLQTAVTINPAHPQAKAYLEQAKLDLAEQRDGTLQSAEAALRDGDSRRALQLTRELLLSQPQSERAQALEARVRSALANQMTALQQQAEHLEQAGDWNGAEDLYRQLSTLDAASPAASQGLERMAVKRREGAAELVKTGELALENGELQPARAAFENALALVPGLTTATLGLERIDALLANLVDEELQAGRRATQSGQLDQAQAHLEKAWRLSHDPAIKAELEQLDKTTARQVDSLLAASRDAIASDDLRHAGQLLAKADRLLPDNIEVKALQADLETRIEVLLHDTLAKAQQALAIGDFPAALSGFRKVLEFRPEQPDALQGLEQGRSGMSKLLDELVSRGEEKMAAGDYEAGRSLARQALDLDPYHRRARQLSKRLDDLQKSGLKPGDEESLYLQGIEFYTQGRYEDAVDAWQRVLILQPGHEKATLNIEKARRKLKQIEEYRHG